MIKIISISTLYFIFGAIACWAILRWVRINVLKLKIGDYVEGDHVVIYDNGNELNRMSISEIVEFKTIIRQRDLYSESNFSTEFVLSDVNGKEIGIYKSVRAVNKLIKIKKISVKKLIVEQL